ncbi:MAG: H-type lectin domain-containing protein [Clostridiales bacterium]|nr:H-type lectin domain-containing protein [Clostridiales bacterium]
MLSEFAYESQDRVPLRLRLDSGVCLEEEITRLTLTAGCSSDTSGPSLGSTVAAYLAVSLAGDGLPALEGAYVTPEVEIGGAWLSLGRFRFETPETGEGTVKVTASDAMIWAMEAGYYPSEPAPDTALGVLADICSQAGVELGDVSGLSDQTVSRVASGYTCREMAGHMAALLGCNALFDREGRLTLRWFSAVEAAIGPEDYYSGGFTRKDYDYVLSSLTAVTGSGEDDRLSAGTGGSGISLTDPYMTEEALEAVWAGLEGFTYRPGEVTVAGDLRLEPGDIVTVTDLAGERYTFPVMNVEHTYDGGFQTKLTAYGSAETDSSASYKGPTTTALERYTADMASFKSLFADKAYLQELLVRGGIVTDTLSGVEINATKYLTGVTIVGDVIQANTLTADKLILTGADGLIYEINATAGGLTSEQLAEEQYQTAIDGSVLVANSVTADRINVTDLFAQDITATGTITGAALVGGSITGTTITGSSLTSTSDDGEINISYGALWGSSNVETGSTILFYLGGRYDGLAVRYTGTESAVYSIYGAESCYVNGTLGVAGAASLGSALTAAGNIIGNSKVVAGTTAVYNDGVPGVQLESGGNIIQKSSGSPNIYFFPNGTTSNPIRLIASSSGLSLNNSFSVTGNGAFSGSLSTYGFTVPEILRGTTSVTLSATSGTQAVTFSKTFSGTPTVVVSPQHASATTITARVYSKSTTGFTFYYTSGATGGTVVFNWIAMYI